MLEENSNLEKESIINMPNLTKLFSIDDLKYELSEYELGLNEINENKWKRLNETIEIQNKYLDDAYKQMNNYLNLNNILSVRFDHSSKCCS